MWKLSIHVTWYTVVHIYIYMQYNDVLCIDRCLTYSIVYSVYIYTYTYCYTYMWQDIVHIYTITIRAMYIVMYVHTCAICICVYMQSIYIYIYICINVHMCYIYIHMCYIYIHIFTWFVNSHAIHIYIYIYRCYVYRVIYIYISHIDALCKYMYTYDVAGIHGILWVYVLWQILGRLMSSGTICCGGRTMGSVDIRATVKLSSGRPWIMVS